MVQPVSVAINTEGGKAIAAYERGILPGPSRFDTYVEALLQGDSTRMRAALSLDEVAGLRLFVGEGQCINCHNGPLLTNNDFHNTGVPAAAGLPTDRGRGQGIEEALADAFNCLGPFSDARPAECGELRFARTDAHGLERQFKVPSLRSVAERAPYMHAGQLASLRTGLRPTWCRSELLPNDNPQSGVNQWRYAPLT